MPFEIGLGLVTGPNDFNLNGLRSSGAAKSQMLSLEDREPEK